MGKQNFKIGDCFSLPTMNLFERAQAVLTEMNVDGWLIACNEGSDIHSKFMLNIEIHIRHYIFIPKTGEVVVITCPMEQPMAEKALRSLGVTGKALAYGSYEDIKSMVEKLIIGKTIALNYGENIWTREGTAFAEYLPLGEFNQLKLIAPTTTFVSAAPIIYNLRSIKTDADIKDLAEAVKVNMEILEDIPNWVKIGMTENEVKRELEIKYMREGGVGFPAIVANNANAADPHHNGSDKKIEKGVLLIDSGMKPRRMTTDITWTYWIGGEPTEKFMHVYNTLYEAKQESYKTIKAGVFAHIPAIKVREEIAARGYDHEKLYNHGLGHALGYLVHDVGIGFRAKGAENLVLEKNMVITHEPGLYWQGEWGVRLEDDLVIETDGVRLLSYIPKDPLII
jgi:Xaa-Pro aminopeptidase